MSEGKQEVIEHLTTLQQMFYDSERWTYAAWIKSAINYIWNSEETVSIQKEIREEGSMSLSEIEAKLEEIDERICVINDYLGLEFN